MRWTERQRAMLREMGVHLWAREDDAAPATAALIERGEVRAASAPADAERSARAPIPAPAPANAARAPASAAKLAPADWLIIGEPLDGADAQQGQLLDNMLRAIGVTRSAPMRERRATFVAVAAATPRVEPQDGDEIATAIATVAPRCIVALGRAAAMAVLGNDAPIGHWRGRRHERAGVPVVVTFSPAFLLRHSEEKAKAWADWCLAVAAIAAPLA